MGMMDELRAMGMAVDEGLDRVMGATDLYEMMLGMFVDSVRDNPIHAEEFDGNDLEELIKKVHAIKGVTGNLSLTPLYEGYNQSLNLLRKGNPSEAKAAYEKLRPVQEEVIACIKRHTA